MKYNEIGGFMNLRKLKNDFKKEIYKEDITKVIKQGLITTILFSILSGGISFIVSTLFGLDSFIFIFILGLVIAKNVRESYYSGHILYPVLSIVFLIFGIIIYETTKEVTSNIVLNLFEMKNILNYFKYGFTEMIDLFNVVAYIKNFSIYSLLKILITLYTIYTTFQNSKNNYY